MSSSASRFGWVGGGVVVVLVLQYLERGLGIFHFRPVPLWLITLALVLAGALLTGIQELVAQRKAVKDVEGSLDVMLACFPPRGAGGLDPYDVGVRPTLTPGGTAPDYATRDADPAIDRAIKQRGMVVLFGPRLCGKSRSGFEAIRRLDDEAPLLVPEDAKGLSTFLGAMDSLPRLKHGLAVLWLDGLDRLLPGLDLDPVDARVHPRPASSKWLRRALRKCAGAIRTWFERLLASARGKDYTPQPPPALKVVATIREGELRRILSEHSDDSHRLRRLLAHSQGIRLDPDLSDTELERFGLPKPSGGKKVTLSQAVQSAWTKGWKPAAAHPEAKTSRERFPKPVALLAGGAALAALLAALVVLGFWGGGLIQPPPVDVQVHRLAERLPPCQTLDEFPKKGKAIKDESDPTGKVLVAVARGADCPATDEVRFYRLEHERLTEIASVRPPERPRYAFSCIGANAKDPCHLTLSGRKQLILGAFSDTRSEQEFPFAVSFANDRMSIAPLGPPTGPAHSLRPEIRRLDAKAVTLRLRVVGKVDRAVTPVPGTACGPSECRLKSHVAQALAVLRSVPRSHPPVLAAGYVATGATDAPTHLIVRAWLIDTPKELPRAHRRRDCIILRGGRPLARPAKVRASDSRETVVDALVSHGAKLLC